VYGIELSRTFSLYDVDRHTALAIIYIWPYMMVMHDRYNHKAIANVWSKENRYKLWLKIELAHLQFLLGGSAPHIELDIPAIEAIEKEIKHDVAAFVQWLEAALTKAGFASANKVHYGLTSSDVVDTAFSMQLRDASMYIEDELLDLTGTIDELMHSHKSIMMIGRTHGQAGELISFKHKLQGWRDTLGWFYDSYTKKYYGKLSGSMGDNKYNSEAYEIVVLDHLKLKSCGPIQGQIISRAYHAEFMNHWATLASIVEKIALDIRLHAQTGIDEFHENFSTKQVGSSSMPHKKNPIICENLTGIARTIRGYQAAAMQNIALWDERDISHSSAERIIFPDASVLIGYQLVKMREVIKGLIIDEAAIKRNIEENQAMLDTQLKLLDAVNQGKSRTDAHREIKEEAQK
jgi:adenylosuccinate lyase